MSAGAFLRSRYESDPGSIHRIRIQPETAALTIDGVTNAPPAGAIDAQGSARVGAGRRSLGVNARLVRLAWTAAAPAGYDANGIITLPWLQQDSFNALVPGAAGSYLGSAVELVGKTAESIR